MITHRQATFLKNIRKGPVAIELYKIVQLPDCTKDESRSRLFIPCRLIQMSQTRHVSKSSTQPLVRACPLVEILSSSARFIVILYQLMRVAFGLDVCNGLSHRCVVLGIAQAAANVVLRQKKRQRSNRCCCRLDLGVPAGRVPILLRWAGLLHWSRTRFAVGRI